MAARAYHKPDNVEILECRPPPGAKITMMMFYAKRAAKEEMKAQGIRVAYIHPREVRRRAEELLRDRWEEFEPSKQRFARPRRRGDRVRIAARRRDGGVAARGARHTSAAVATEVWVVSHFS
jgi:hypothetical protein